MSASKSLVLENLSRAVAIWGSATAAVVFGVGFATDTQLLNSLYQTAQLQYDTFRVPLFFVLLTAMFGAYVLAGKQKWEMSGSVFALTALAAVYAWSRLGMEVALGPYALVLAIPALFHVLAAKLHRDEASEAEENMAPVEVLPSAA